MDQIYTEKEVLGDALTAQKTCTNNYNTYSNECVHKELRDVFYKLLDQEHSIQNDVFEMMHSRGLYPTPEAEEKKVEEAKQKFSCGVKETGTF